MLKLIRFIVLIIFCNALCFAADVSLEWDPSPSEGVDGYHIYGRNFEANQYGADNILWTGAQTACTVTVLSDRQTAFVATAFNSLAESGHSNEVVFEPTITPPGKPVISVRRLDSP